MKVLLRERGYPRIPPCKPLKQCVLKIYDAKHLIINFFKKNVPKRFKMAQRHAYYILYRYCLFFHTSYIMDFLALNDDVKFIIYKHLASDLKIYKFS